MTDDQDQSTTLRSRRIPFCQRVLIAPKHGGERRIEESFDLSLGGMFITTMMPLEVGEILDFEMPLDSLRFRASAKVAWIRGSEGDDGEPTGMAIEFIRLNQDQKRLIHRQISNHTRGGGELRVGSPPTADRNSATRPKPARRTAAPQQDPFWKRLLEPPARLWLIAGAGAVVIAMLLLALLI